MKLVAIQRRRDLLKLFLPAPGTKPSDDACARQPDKRVATMPLAADVKTALRQKIRKLQSDMDQAPRDSHQESGGAESLSGAPPSPDEHGPVANPLGAWLHQLPHELTPPRR